VPELLRWALLHALFTQVPRRNVFGSSLPSGMRSTYTAIAHTELYLVDRPTSGWRQAYRVWEVGKVMLNIKPGGPRGGC
jgi:hypothetical protein